MWFKMKLYISIIKYHFLSCDSNKYSFKYSFNENYILYQYLEKY